VPLAELAPGPIPSPLRRAVWLATRLALWAAYGLLVAAFGVVAFVALSGSPITSSGGRGGIKPWFHLLWVVALVMLLVRPRRLKRSLQGLHASPIVTLAYSVAMWLATALHGLLTLLSLPRPGPRAIVFLATWHILVVVVTVSPRSLVRGGVFRVLRSRRAGWALASTALLALACGELSDYGARIEWLGKRQALCEQRVADAGAFDANRDVFRQQATELRDAHDAIERRLPSRTPRREPHVDPSASAVVPHLAEALGSIGASLEVVVAEARRRDFYEEVHVEGRLRWPGAERTELLATLAGAPRAILWRSFELVPATSTASMHEARVSFTVFWFYRRDLDELALPDCTRGHAAALFPPLRDAWVAERQGRCMASCDALTEIATTADEAERHRLARRELEWQENVLENLTATTEPTVTVLDVLREDHDVPPARASGSRPREPARVGASRPRG